MRNFYIWVLLVLLAGCAGQRPNDEDVVPADLEGLENTGWSLVEKTEKTVPVGNDVVGIEDSQASNAIKYVKLSNLPVSTPVQDAMDALELGAGSVTSVNGEAGAVVIDAGDVDIVDAGSLITATTTEGALQENRTAINLNTAKVSMTGEGVQDIAGAMVTGNTETNITVTYDDADGTMDFVVPDIQVKYVPGTETDFTGCLLNPAAIYTNDSVNHVAGSFFVEAAITVTEINVTCDADPTTELTVSFYHKANTVGYGSATLIDSVTTVAGTATETTISDATVPAGMVYYTLSNPDATIKNCTWNMVADYD